ncbi:uncharacterized protein Z519_04263 [Cladophialophora bantiana CBS 173.52]|uniref:Prion-inhibition and propagation HeLo domain-containing protein n=1 Tax=Cladophialophora bantiana (strain ATCC 10958 / CBS 173.52 / CDC B-1940 / NIH 8579) TaxID=1442370 RepID=A0A0D2HQF6_CLAB1|nr:uncharacterized protein Z519_04263 [Cladophialophora bantiana CBS 173.52]KIW95678.1 hypothetical protein Z519_04263 [Cladophialophora bantiana CBS 173.52]
MQNLDLTASKWASPDVRRERESQVPTWTRRAPSPQTHNNGSFNSLQQPQHQNQPLSPKPLSSAQRRYLSRQAELQRFRRLFRRLAWKANSLTHWSHRALNLAQEHQNQRHHNSNGPSNELLDQQWAAGPRATLGPYDLIIDPVDAERQFKIDFYEFYALLERGLVCLLGVWGIVITASAAAAGPMAEGDDTGTASSSSKTQGNGGGIVSGSGSGSSQPPAIIGDSLYFQGAAHRFHANVLAALDHPSNPLHSILGTGPVREYIGVAKEFRNKWKDVESRPEDSFRGPERVEEEWDPAKTRRYEKVLHDLKLEELLGSVLRALEEAGRKAEAEIERLGGSLLGGGAASKSNIVGGPPDVVDFDMQDAPFEVMDRQGGELDYEMEF